MSLAGIVCGVSLFILTQAQTSGFEGFFVKTIWGTNGVIRVADRFQDTLRSMSVQNESKRETRFEYSHTESKRYIEGVENSRQVMEAVRQFQTVSGVSQIVNGSVTFTNDFRTKPAQLFGIEPEDYLAVSDLEEQIVFGSLEQFRHNKIGILVGRTLAERMLIDVGDPVIVWSKGENFRFRVSGVFQTGVSSIDSFRLFVRLDQARTVLQKPHGASFLQVNLFDESNAETVALHMSAVLNHAASSWQERERVWLEAFRALRVSSAITVSTIILISGLGMFNTLAIIVMEKRREIAILRSMGYTRNDVSSIFLLQGMLVLALGTFLGSGLGAAFTFGVSKLPIRIRGIFSTDYFVVHWSVWHYIAAALTSLVVVFVASYLPARQAARLEPADIIRGTGQ